MNRVVNSLVWLIAIGWVTTACGLASASQVPYSSLPLPAIDITGQDVNGNAPTANAAELASAQTIESQFLGALSSSYTQNYDSLSASFSPFSPQTLPFGSITGTGEFTGIAPTSFEGLDVSSPNGLYYNPQVPGSNNDITFSSPITAFGSYFLNVGDHDANHPGTPDTLTLRLQNTILNTTSDVSIGTLGPNASFGNVFYFGVTDTNPFNKVTVISTNVADDGYVLDNTTIAPVPEPGTLALCGLAGGLLVAGCGLRRKAAAGRIG